MYEKKYFRTLILIILSWTITICDSNLNKSKLIKSTEIFDNGEIVSINSILRAGSTDTSTHQNVLYTATKCAYAKTIVDLLQSFFEIFLHGVHSHENTHFPDNFTKNWLISAIIQFNSLKPPITKMIDDLFFRSDESKLLRTTDPSLLKSLLSINLFLEHSINDSPFIVYSEPVTNDQNEYFRFINDNDLNETIQNIRILNTSIIQMIGLVERFRSKRCVVGDPYEYNSIVNKKLNDDNLIHDIDFITRLLEPSLHKLHVLVNKGSDNYNGFNNNLYDSEFLLFANVLEYNDWFLGNVQIYWNNEVYDLKSIYIYVKSTYNIELVLEFQQILIQVIADVFYIQIRNLSNYSQYGITNLNYLYANFLSYTDKMLPNNCAINVCNKILKARIMMGKILESYNNPVNSDLFTTLYILFEPEDNIELISQEIPLEFVDSSLSFLFDYIWNDIQFTSFKRVVRLLSYESYTNKDFYITKVSDYVKIISSQSYDPKFLKSVIEVQYVLFSFWTLLKMENNHQISSNIMHYSNYDLYDLSVIGFTTPNNDTGKRKKKLHNIMCPESDVYGPMFSEMLQVIVELYFTKLLDKPEIKNILLPFLVHFQYTNELSCQQSIYDLSVMLQITFLTITVVENYLIKKYSLALYSLFIYSKFIMNDEIGPTTFRKIRHDLQTYAEMSTNKCNNALMLLKNVFNVDSYSNFFPYNNEQFEFFWNGRKQFGHAIFLNVTKGVTDLNDLSSIQWFGIKWSLSNILMKISNALSLLESESGSVDIYYIIKSKLNELLLLDFPTPIDLFLDDILNATLTTLSIDWAHFNYFHFKHLFISSLVLLDAHPSDNEPPDLGIENIMNDLDFEIEQLKVFTNEKFLPIDNTLFLIYLNLSPVEEIFYDVILEILYEVY